MPRSVRRRVETASAWVRERRAWRKPGRTCPCMCHSLEQEEVGAQVPTLYSSCRFLLLIQSLLSVLLPILCLWSTFFFWASRALQIWLVLNHEIAVSTRFETPQLEGNRCFWPVHFIWKLQMFLWQMKQRSFWEITKSSPLGNSAGARLGLVARACYSSYKIKSPSRVEEKEALCKWHGDPISLPPLPTLRNPCLGSGYCIV